MRKGPIRGFLSSFLFLVVLLCARGQGTIVGAGYTPPAPLSVAPGQIVTLYVSGLGANFPTPVIAPAGPTLPMSLGGVSVTLLEFVLMGSAAPIPILDVRDVSTCPGGPISGFSINCGSVTAITVQLPSTLNAYRPSCAVPGPEYPPCQDSWLYVTFNNQLQDATELNPLTDQVRILTACDSVFHPAPVMFPSNLTGLPCAPMVTHQDGSLVSAGSPAKAGEALTAWAAGLGGASQGFFGEFQIPTFPISTLVTFRVAYNFTPNALANKPGPNALEALYSGLVAGYAGLYQINFTVPSVPPGTAPCAKPGSYVAGANVVQSNLTVSFGGNFSFDGAGICVAAN